MDAEDLLFILYEMGRKVVEKFRPLLFTFAWNWYFEHVGHEKCPIVNTWWQTETGCMEIERRLSFWLLTDLFDHKCRLPLGELNPVRAEFEKAVAGISVKFASRGDFPFFEQLPSLCS